MKETIKNRKGLTDVSTSKVKAAKSRAKVCVWPKENLLRTPKKENKNKNKHLHVDHVIRETMVSSVKRRGDERNLCTFKYYS